MSFLKRASPSVLSSDFLAIIPLMPEERPTNPIEEIEHPQPKETPREEANRKALEALEYLRTCVTNGI